MVPSSWPISLNLAGRRILHQNCDPTLKNKITEVALLRADSAIGDVGFIDEDRGLYDGMTTNLNHGGPGSYLYLVWRSVFVD